MAGRDRNIVYLGGLFLKGERAREGGEGRGRGEDGKREKGEGREAIEGVRICPIGRKKKSRRLWDPMNYTVDYSLYFKSL